MNRTLSLETRTLVKLTATALLLVAALLAAPATSSAACTPACESNCGRIANNCFNNGLPASACMRAYQGCLARCGC